MNVFLRMEKERGIKNYGNLIVAYHQLIHSSRFWKKEEN